MLANLKTPLFTLIIILNETIYIKTIIQIILIKTFYFFSLLYIRMNGKNINFNNEKIKKSDFYNKNKKIFNIDYIDVNKILISKKETYGE